jgi:streptogramin lyase
LEIRIGSVDLPAGTRFLLISALLAGCGGGGAGAPNGSGGTSLTSSGGTGGSTAGNLGGSAGAVSCSTTAGRLGDIEVNGPIVEFTIPMTGFKGAALQFGPDGNLYYSNGNDVLKLSSTSSEPLATTLSVTYSSVANFGNMGGFTFGPDGKLWATDARANQVDRIESDLSVTVFQGPDSNDSHVSDQEYGAIIVGPDNNLWFIGGQQDYGKLERIQPDGTFLPTWTMQGLGPTLVAGADGLVWIDLADGASTVSADGTVTHVGSAIGGSTILGPDGNVWTNVGGNSIRSATPTGTITTVTIPHLGNQAPDPINGTISAIATGSDGNIWFTITGVARGVGHLSSAGDNFASFLLPQGCATTSDPRSIAGGPAGTVWFAEPTAQRIGRVSP